MDGANAASEIGSVQQPVQHTGQNQRHHECHHQREAQDDAVGDEQQFGLERRRRAQRLAAEDHQQAVLQDKADAQGELNNHQHVNADDGLDQVAIKHGADHDKDRQRDRDRDVGIQRQRAPQAVAEEHAERDEIAVAEVDDAADAIDDAETERDESVGRADQKTLDQSLN